MEKKQPKKKPAVRRPANYARQLVSKFIKENDTSVPAVSELIDGLRKYVVEECCKPVDTKTIIKDFERKLCDHGLLVPSRHSKEPDGILFVRAVGIPSGSKDELGISGIYYRFSTSTTAPGVFYVYRRYPLSSAVIRNNELHVMSNGIRMTFQIASRKVYKMCIKQAVEDIKDIKSVLEALA